MVAVKCGSQFIPLCGSHHHGAPKVPRSKVLTFFRCFFFLNSRVLVVCGLLSLLHPADGFRATTFPPNGINRPPLSVVASLVYNTHQENKEMKWRTRGFLGVDFFYIFDFKNCSSYTTLAGVLSFLYYSTFRCFGTNSGMSKLYRHAKCLESLFINLLSAKCSPKKSG